MKRGAIVSVPRASVSAALVDCDAGEIDAVDHGLRRWLGLD